MNNTRKKPDTTVKPIAKGDIWMLALRSSIKAISFVSTIILVITLTSTRKKHKTPKEQIG